MRIRWRGLELPSRVTRDPQVSTDTYAKFSAEPFERGFGTTVGNSLRRILLSSLEGAAVTHIRLKGADHEFSSLPGVMEDVTDIILNIKSLIVKLDGDELLRVRVVRLPDPELVRPEEHVRQGVRCADVLQHRVPRHVPAVAEHTGGLVERHATEIAGLFAGHAIGLILVIPAGPFADEVDLRERRRAGEEQHAHDETPHRQQPGRTLHENHVILHFDSRSMRRRWALSRTQPLGDSSSVPSATSGM